jgi:hypothetical protein
MPGAESQVGLGMGEVMVPEAGAQHDSTNERTFQKIPSRKTTAHRRPPFFSLGFSTTPHLYIMPYKKSMTEGLVPSFTLVTIFIDDLVKNQKNSLPIDGGGLGWG